MAVLRYGAIVNTVTIIIFLSYLCIAIYLIARQGLGRSSPWIWLALLAICRLTQVSLDLAATTIFPPKSSANSHVHGTHTAVHGNEQPAQCDNKAQRTPHAMDSASGARPARHLVRPYRRWRHRSRLPRRSDVCCDGSDQGGCFAVCGVFRCANLGNDGYLGALISRRLGRSQDPDDCGTQLAVLCRRHRLHDVLCVRELEAQRGCGVGEDALQCHQWQCHDSIVHVRQLEETQKPDKPHHTSILLTRCRQVVMEYIIAGLYLGLGLGLPSKAARLREQVEDRMNQARGPDADQLQETVLWKLHNAVARIVAAIIMPALQFAHWMLGRILRP
jgi:hypothetical protein